MKRFERLNIVAMAAVLFLSALAIPFPATAATGAYVTGQVVVKFKDGTGDGAINGALSDAGAKKKAKLNSLGVNVVEVARGQEVAAVAKLSRSADVEYAELDTLNYAVSTDPYFANQYGLNNTGQVVNGKAGTVDADIDAPEAWAVTRGAGVKVAILDSGIDQDHEDLVSKVVLQQNFSTSTTIDDLYGHGTHVAGIVAASTDNSVGVAGVCPDCQLIIGKVLGDNGSGANSAIANGITWAADNGAQVINLSLGSVTSSTVMSKAVSYAWNKGAVVVAAAGNNGSKAKFYPAAYTSAIAVAATDNRDARANFSNYGGSWVDVAAPGASIYSTLPNHANAIGSVLNYGYLNGTSMASPAVAGAAALVWSTSYGTSNTNVRLRVESGADKIVGTGSKLSWAYGRVNAARAVTP